MDLGNRTLATEVILLGFSDNIRVNIVLFLLFFLIYLVTVAGNVFMICVIIISPHLHTPMYFFLCNLSFIDFSYSSLTVPKLLVDLLTADRRTSILSCGLQVYFGTFLGSTESLTIVVMAYDRYVAICKPLYYHVLMRWSVCYRLLALVWISCFMTSVVPSAAMPMRVCNPNQINHFVCEVLAVIKLSCDSIAQNNLVIFSVSFMSLLLPFLFIIITYVFIISSILKFHSAERSKAFSTCTSHVIVVVLFYGTAMIMYFGPSSHFSSNQGKYIAVFYAVIIPMLNPLIYSLKNREVKKIFLPKEHELNVRQLN